VLTSTHETAAKLQKASGFEKVYLRFSFYLTNALTGANYASSCVGSGI
jgi:hypothetical protein